MKLTKNSKHVENIYNTSKEVNERKVVDFHYNLSRSILYYIVTQSKAFKIR